MKPTVPSTIAMKLLERPSIIEPSALDFSVTNAAALLP
jgi:hypothetical protein